MPTEVKDKKKNIIKLLSINNKIKINNINQRYSSFSIKFCYNIFSYQKNYFTLKIVY